MRRATKMKKLLICIGLLFPMLLQAKMYLDFDLKVLNRLPKLSWGGDPFEKGPGYMTTTPKTEIINANLEAVVIDSEDPVAIIDGKNYREGFFIQDYRIIEIGKNYVVLEKDFARTELKIPLIEEKKEVLDVYLYEREIANE